jgi:hypothetical protein
MPKYSFLKIKLNFKPQFEELYADWKFKPTISAVKAEINVHKNKLSLQNKVIYMTFLCDVNRNAYN